MSSKENHLSKNLKFLRKRDRYTQEKLGKRVGLTRNAISSYEDGRAQPRIETVLKLCSTFNLPVDRLFYTDIQSGDTIAHLGASHQEYIVVHDLIQQKLNSVAGVLTKVIRLKEEIQDQLVEINELFTQLTPKK